MSWPARAARPSIAPKGPPTSMEREGNDERGGPGRGLTLSRNGPGTHIPPSRQGGRAWRHTCHACITCSLTTCVWLTALRGTPPALCLPFAGTDAARADTRSVRTYPRRSWCSSHLPEESARNIPTSASRGLARGCAVEGRDFTLAALMPCLVSDPGGSRWLPAARTPGDPGDADTRLCSAPGGSRWQPAMTALETRGTQLR